jgi:hypothetical protein
MDPPQNDLVLQLKKLFVLREDTYAVQGAEGGYVRAEAPLSDEELLAHLRGEKVVGVYQLSRDSRVKWAVWDIDAHNGGTEDALSSARRLYEHLQKGIFKDACLLEFSGGGYHVWLFFSEPLPASGVKELAERLAEEAGVRAEVFPKQGELPPDGYGNLVKLPLGRNLKWGNWSVLLDPPSLLDIKPIRVPSLPEKRKKEEEEAAVPLFGGCVAIARIIQGVDEGMRNESAFLLARAMCCLGLSYDMSLAALRAWNRRNRPPLQERELETSAKSAYSRRYSVSGWSIRKGSLSELCTQCAARVCERGGKKEGKRKGMRQRNVLEVPM